MARDLLAVGAGRAEAAAYVADAARAWMAAGCLAPREVLEVQPAPHAVRRVRLDELTLDLRFSGEASPATFDPVFGQLYEAGERGAGDSAAGRLDLVGQDGLVFLLKDGEPLAAAPPPDASALLKAELTEAYVESVETGFLAHGALLVRGEATLIVSGAPGAGKTTLTLALASSGWTYGGDDIVRIDPDARVRGAPFAAAVKSGAWALAARFAPDLLGLPIALRADGQQVRYWRPARLADRAPRAPTAVVLLARQAGAAASLEAIAPLEALHALVESAYAAHWRLDGDALAALAGRLETATCARLVYEDLDAAVALIESLG
ncbi:P-loop NTPase family protein [Phenylobacterium soli]|uniref:Serine kinase n=1 Tax=Phenylobacterium soli TaxID=2170551 RepID=A0A328AEC0_9CAUL|nr:hypothetical protein [Phenylobacterium soli]RAK51734.1 hypothetical protein DJ017_18050 [Phenylobacterium soli]